MPAIPYIKKQIGETHLVWFQNSNSYLQLMEPAWFVFMKITKQFDTETIAGEFADRYSISHEESLNFVIEIGTEFEKLNQPDNSDEKIKEYSNKLTAYKFKPYSTYNYRFGNSFLEFSFESLYFEKFIHPLICHFESEERTVETPLLGN